MTYFVATYVLRFETYNYLNLTPKETYRNSLVVQIDTASLDIDKK